MMSDGYVDWLALAPEGKIPTRLGTAENPTEYADGWKELRGRRRHQGAAVRDLRRGRAEAASSQPDTIKRWGLPQGQGALAGAVGGQFVIPNVLSETINSGERRDARSRRPRSNAIKGDLGL